MTQAEELLKEADEMMHLLIQDSENDNLIHKSLGLRAKIISHLQSAPKDQEAQVTATPVTWEQARNKTVREYNYDNWDHFVENCTGIGQMESMYEQCFATFMEANRQQRWIPVEERLPEEDVEVTVVIEHVTCKDRHVRTMRLAPDMFQCWIFYDNSVLGSIYKVILWQPLPEIPKEFKG